MQTDVAIIGAGVIGTLIARRLSRYDLNIALLDRRHDVAQGATKANSAIVHAGFDAKFGSLKAKMNVRGNQMMSKLCQELHVPFRQNGSMVVGFSKEDRNVLADLFERGKKNGVPGLKLLDEKEVFAREPNLGAVTGALFAPTGGIVSPFELAMAAADCAVLNGVVFYRNFRISAINMTDSGFLLQGDGKELSAKFVINAAGVHADDVAGMIDDQFFNIKPRRGEYLVLDHTQKHLVNSTIFQCPSVMGKGILVTPTVHGNILVGPTAEDLVDKDDVATTAQGLRSVRESAARLLPKHPINAVITAFTGLRAHSDVDDFIIQASERNDKFFHVAGIESPGLTGAPAIAEYVEQNFLKRFHDVMREKMHWQSGRPKPLRLAELEPQERAAVIKKNPLYGRVVCRCERVTEGEIVDAIHAPVGARDVDGVKFRTRAGMGRCQGGFCATKVVELISQELGIPPEEVKKSGEHSRILVKSTK